MGDLMIASQGGAIWLWILSRPFGWWPTLKLTLGPRVRMYFAAGSAVFAPSRTATQAAGTRGELRVWCALRSAFWCSKHSTVAAITVGCSRVHHDAGTGCRAPRLLDLWQRTPQCCHRPALWSPHHDEKLRHRLAVESMELDVEQVE